MRRRERFESEAFWGKKGVKKKGICECGLCARSLVRPSGGKREREREIREELGIV